jgi:AAA domain
MPSNLSPSQALAFKTCAVLKQSLLLTAKAGSGKSYILKLILVALESEGYSILRCAASGKAASLIEGITVHRSANLGTGTSMVLPFTVPPEPKLWEGKKRHTADSRVSGVSQLWLQPKLVCAIDEVYQLSSTDGRLWYDLGMKLRSTSKEPLAPPIFILSGDIGQFLPISGDLIFEPARFSYFNQRGLVEYLTLPSILSEIELTKIELKENMRQSDPTLQRALDWLYYGVAIHPKILERVQPAPANTPTYYYNNALVKSENETQLAKYIKAPAQVYAGVGETLSAAEIQSMLPITERMTIHLGAPFTITNNIFTHKGLEAANGEVVTISAHGRRSVKAIKKDGSEIELPYVPQYLPYNRHNGKQKIYQTLPGYPGSACSIWKVQGETLETSVKFAVWQIFKSEIKPLSNAGALYTICSRVTDLKFLYFDISLGVERSKQLLIDSLSVNYKVQKFLLADRAIKYATDIFKKEVVVEIIEQVSIKPTVDIKVFKYHLTDLITNKEKTLVVSFKSDFTMLEIGELVGSKIEPYTDSKWVILFERLARSYK